MIYINIKNKDAVSQFNRAFYSILEKLLSPEKDLIFLCIGTDLATGDSLGPLVGYKLRGLNASIYGNLQIPVHAKNLKETIKTIYSKHKNPFIIAIDAGLGRSVGYLTIGEGGIKPGAALGKQLGQIGHMYITGIVNENRGVQSLQNTRLGLVMQMADIVSDGILKKGND
ncbi:MAG: spore protease YyaC [Defluviitaleaceae bacterium]|nr:spore protease YyaC [Defluviitaleaceae bacterium]